MFTQKPFFVGVLYYKQSIIFSVNIENLEVSCNTCKVFPENFCYLNIALKISRQISLFVIFRTSLCSECQFLGEKVPKDTAQPHYMTCVSFTNHVITSSWRLSICLIIVLRKSISEGGGGNTRKPPCFWQMNWIWIPSWVFHQSFKRTLQFCKALKQALASCV